MKPPHFVLDTDTLITAKNRYYAFDICPSFWSSLLTVIQNSQAVVIDKVLDEVLAGNDELTTWMKANVATLSVASSDGLVIAAYRQMAAWVQCNQQFNPAAKAEFLDSADGWVAAYASVHNATVVTLETLDPNIQKRVKLPNVCRRFNVDYIDTFEMLRRLGIQF